MNPVIEQIRKDACADEFMKIAKSDKSDMAATLGLAGAATGAGVGAAHGAILSKANVNYSRLHKKMQKWPLGLNKIKPQTVAKVMGVVKPAAVLGTAGLITGSAFDYFKNKKK